jgi:hypothetical protein
MPFSTASGFAAISIASRVSAGNTAARLLYVSGAPTTAISRDSLLQKISSSVCEGAITSHKIDFERVDRRTEGVLLLKNTLQDLKTRMAHKVGAHTRLFREGAPLKLSYKAG